MRLSIPRNSIALYLVFIYLAICYTLAYFLTIVKDFWQFLGVLTIFFPQAVLIKIVLPLIFVKYGIAIKIIIALIVLGTAYEALIIFILTND